MLEVQLAVARLGLAMLRRIARVLDAQERHIVFDERSYTTRRAGPNSTAVPGIGAVFVAPRSIQRRTGLDGFTGAEGRQIALVRVGGLRRGLLQPAREQSDEIRTRPGRCP
jgi:hypothetical protein